MMQTVKEWQILRRKGFQIFVEITYDEDRKLVELCCSSTNDVMQQRNLSAFRL